MLSPSSRSVALNIPVFLLAVIAVVVSAALPNTLIGIGIGLALVVPGAFVSGVLIARLSSRAVEREAELVGHLEAAKRAAEELSSKPGLSGAMTASAGESLHIAGLNVPCMLIGQDGQLAELSRSFEAFVEQTGSALQLPVNPDAAAEALLQQADVRAGTSGQTPLALNGQKLSLLAMPFSQYGTLVAVVADDRRSEDKSTLTISLSASGKITQVSRAFAAATGRNPADLIGRPLHSFVPTNRTATAEVAGQSSEGGVAEFAMPDGSTKWLAFVFEPSSSGGERQASAVDLQSAAPQLAAELSRYRALSQTLPMVAVDDQGHFTWLNENFSSLLGRAPDELTHKPQSACLDAVSANGVSMARTKNGDVRLLKTMEAPLAGTQQGCRVRVFVDATDQEAIRSQQIETLQAERDSLTNLVSSLMNSLDKAHTDETVPLLSQPYPEGYKEFCAQFNKVANLINMTRSSLARTIEPINMKAGVIESAAQEMAERTESQAATLEQSSTALEELSGNLRSSVQKTNDIERQIQAAQSSAREGESVVKDAVSAMGEISSSSDEISQIIGLIDDIAFQTNLLALNAGVEAARAGDAGRGFAVVASEVRALAQRSSDAAKQIKDLISKSAQEVSNGVALVDKTGAVLEGIVEAIDGITGSFVEVNATTKEQAEGLAEVTTAVSDLDQVTQQNAAMAEENIAVGRELRESIANLATLGASSSSKRGMIASPKVSGGRRKPAARTVAASSPAQRVAAQAVAAPSSTVQQQQARAASAVAQMTPANAPSEAFDDDWADF